jgi:TolC family type I secretion outer membrane protein
MIVSLLLAAAVAAQDTTGLTLADAVRKALDTNPAVGAARAGREAAQAAVGEARAPLFPRLTASFSATQYKIGYLVYPLSGIDVRNPPIFNRTVSQGAISLGYTLFDFGGRLSRLHAAVAQEGRAASALDAARAAVVARVANAYLRVLSTRGVLDAQEQELAALGAEARRVGLMESQGKAAHVDVLSVEARASRARADEVATRTQLVVAEQDLARLTGLPIDAARAANLLALRLADTAVAGRDALVAEALSASPEVSQAQRAAEAAAAGAGAARAALFPQLQFSAAYVENGHTFTGYRPWWNAGLQVSYPIFAGGGLRATARENEATARAAREQLRAARQAAEQGVEAALASVSAARASVEALETAVAQSAEVERIRQLSLQVGSGTETDYLEAEAALLSNRASLVQARHAEMGARVELARVTGELTPEWLSRVLATAR